MHTLKNAAGKGFLAIALLCFSFSGAFALELTGEEAAAFKNYEAAISSANPAAAKKFLEDAALMEKVKIAAPDKAADLIAKARAVGDLEQLLDRAWAADQDMQLSYALGLRIDFDKPLEKVNIGPVPETLLDWMAKYKKYTVAKTLTIKKAIREFETVFDAYTTEDKARWKTKTIRERNSSLSDKAAKSLEHLINFEVETDKNFQNEVKNDDVFKYLDSVGRARYERYLNQLATAELAKVKLSRSELDKIKDQPIEQQMFYLGSLFDNSKNKSSAAIERKVDGARQSKPGETLSFQNNRILAEMLRTAMAGELKGTAAGDKVLEFYNSGAKLDIAIESCQGCYAKYEPSTGRIIMDSEVILQYMRVNNINAETLLFDPKNNKSLVAALAKYMSPMLVHEATHQMQHDWAEKAQIYKPYVQEDEIESNSLESLYTIEKLKKDPKFKALFSNMRSGSAYADQRLKLAQRFNKNPDDFDDSVRRLYYYGIPSFDAASSQILSAISAELERRMTMPAADRAQLENSGAEFKDTLGMTVQKLTASVAGIRTDALKIVRDDLLNKAVYTGRYETASDRTGAMLETVRACETVKSRPVPAL